MRMFNGILALKSELLQISIDEHMKQLYVLEDERQKWEEEELINTRLTTMTAIEKRASQYATNGDEWAAYWKGAKEQRNIDIKEFADRLTEMQGEYITLELINDLVKELKE